MPNLVLLNAPGPQGPKGQPGTSGPPGKDATVAGLNILDFFAAAGGDNQGINDCWQAFTNAIKQTSSAALSKGNYIAIPAGTYFFSKPLEVSRSCVIRGAGGGAYFSNTILKFPAGVDGVIFKGQASSSDGGGADYSTLEHLSVQASGTSSSADGILISAHGVILHDVSVVGFQQDGVHVVGNSGASPSTNANDWRIDTLVVNSCGRHGIHVEGTDANAGVAVHVDVSVNGGWGIYDESALGNTYLGVQAADNTLGPAFVTGSSNGTVLDVYVESGPQSIIDTSGASPACFVTGRGDIDFTAGSKGFLTGNHYMHVGTSGENAQFKDSSDPTIVCIVAPNAGGDHNSMISMRFAGTKDLPDWQSNTVYKNGIDAILDSVSGHAFISTVGGTSGTARPTFNTASGTTTNDNGVIWTESGTSYGETAAMCWKYGDAVSSPKTGFASAPGWYNLTWNNSSSHVGISLAGGAADTSTGYSAGMPAFNMGFVMGSPHARDVGGAAALWQTGTAAPLTGTHYLGDIVWNTSPIAGGEAGWICVTAGTPGTWKTFGAIAA